MNTRLPLHWSFIYFFIKAAGACKGNRWPRMLLGLVIGGSHHCQYRPNYPTYWPSAIQARTRNSMLEKNVEHTRIGACDSLSPGVKRTLPRLYNQKLFGQVARRPARGIWHVRPLRLRAVVMRYSGRDPNRSGHTHYTCNMGFFSLNVAEPRFPGLLPLNAL